MNTNVVHYNVFDHTGMAAQLSAAIRNAGDRLFEFSKEPHFDRAIAPGLLDALRLELETQIRIVERGAERLEATASWTASLSLTVAMTDARTFVKELGSLDREGEDDLDGLYASGLQDVALNMLTRDHAQAVHVKYLSTAATGTQGVSRGN